MARKLQKSAPPGQLEPEKPEPEITRYRAVWSGVTRRFYFAPKVVKLGEDGGKIVGRKFDITDDLQPYLAAKYRRKDG